MRAHGQQACKQSSPRSSSLRLTARPITAFSLSLGVQIMDASDFNKGPIAKVWLTHHVPHGLHGCYSNYYFGP